jgi:two-component system LytT family response regulator
MIRALIVDDEPVARQRVMALLAGETDVEIVGECASGSEACLAIERAAPDLVFLDVQMPEMDGFAVVERVGSRMPPVVFVTAYHECAVRAFEVHALDYLLKPFSGPRFKRALAPARGQLSRRLGSADARSSPAQPRAADRLAVKSNGRIYFVKATDVDWCEASGNYIALHIGAQEHIVRETMNRLETKLDRQQFIRIHRSTIVNIDRVQELRSSFGGESVVLLRGGTRLTLSRGYREHLMTRLGQRL